MRDLDDCAPELETPPVEDWLLRDSGASDFDIDCSDLGFWENQSAIAQKEFDEVMDRQVLAACFREELRSGPLCPVCGGWTVMEVGRNQSRCMKNPEHTP